jgi:hypothetical protein
VWQPPAQEMCDSQQVLFVPENQNNHYSCNFRNKEKKVDDENSRTNSYTR